MNKHPRIQHSLILFFLSLTCIVGVISIVLLNYNLLLSFHKQWSIWHNSSEIEIKINDDNVPCCRSLSYLYYSVICFTSGIVHTLFALLFFIYPLVYYVIQEKEKKGIKNQQIQMKNTQTINAKAKIMVNSDDMKMLLEKGNTSSEVKSLYEDEEEESDDDFMFRNSVNPWNTSTTSTGNTSSSLKSDVN